MPIHRQNHQVMEEVTQDFDGLSLNNNNDEKMGLGLEDFEVLKLVGLGGYGKVYQVRKIDTSEIFAMKIVQKENNNHAQFTYAEEEILSNMDHPFIVHLRYSFRTNSRLHLVFDYINGGELYFHIGNQGLFPEDLARFYAAEIVSAVSHLHANGIIHGDIKSENVLLDAEGHVVLVDFGLAKKSEDRNRCSSYTLCGTAEFMAPEIILRRSYDKSCDWWSVGILLYEMLVGNVPFEGSRREVRQKIVKGKIRLPCWLRRDAVSLLKGLLRRDATKRLGSGGGEEVKRHEWFGCIDWEKLEKRQIRPSFVPKVDGKQCTANFEECFTNMTVAHLNSGHLSKAAVMKKIHDSCRASTV